jgi:hypothetical protein
MPVLSAAAPTAGGAIARRGRFPIRAALAFAALLGVAVDPAAGASRATREYDLKAAFLYNFAQFVEWPADAFESPGAPFVIGIVGTDPFGQSLDEIVAGEAVRGHSIVVRRWRTLEEMGPAHVLFISRGQAARLGDLATAVDDRSILTVGDGNDFATRVGIIGFVVAGNHVRLVINVARARAANLTISSQLLRQSQLVEAAP